jgi:hypothetical protein
MELDYNRTHVQVMEFASDATKLRSKEQLETA